MTSDALRLGAVGYVIKDQPRAYLELLPLEIPTLGELGLLVLTLLLACAGVVALRR